MAYCDAFCFAFRSLSLFLELVQVQQEVFQEAGGESLTRCLETTMRCSCQSSGFEEVGSDKSCGSNAGRLRLKQWLARSVWRSGLEKPWPSSARGTFLSSQHTLLVGDIPSKESAEISSQVIMQTWLACGPIENPHPV
jgi:hypothetical protein